MAWDCCIKPMLSILIIDESRARVTELVFAGHRVAAVLPSVLDLSAQIEALRPDVILIETESPSRDTLEHLALLNRNLPRPLIMLTPDGNVDVMRAAFKAGVSAYVADALDLARLNRLQDVAIVRFEEHQSLKAELATAKKKKLSERKVVEKAKGILMKSRKLDEEQAYAALRNLAMERAQPLEKVAGTWSKWRNSCCKSVVPRKRGAHQSSAPPRIKAQSQCSIDGFTAYRQHQLAGRGCPIFPYLIWLSG